MSRSFLHLNIQERSDLFRQKEKRPMRKSASSVSVIFLDKAVFHKILFFIYIYFITLIVIDVK